MRARLAWFCIAVAVALVGAAAVSLASRSSRAADRRRWARERQVRAFRRGVRGHQFTKDLSIRTIRLEARV